MTDTHNLHKEIFQRFEKTNKKVDLLLHTGDFTNYGLEKEVKQFSKDIKYLEDRKYPNLFKERLKMQSKAKSLEKKKDKMKINDMGDKKLQKAMIMLALRYELQI